MPESFAPVENKVCDRSIGFHFANGKIHDTNGEREKKTTSWRSVRPPAETGTTGLIDMVVNVENQMIKWRYEGEEFAKSTLTDYLRGQKCVAYISMVHAKDTVILTPKKKRSR